MYVYKQTDRNPDLFTVGFYTPDGAWEPESDCTKSEEAADRVHYLNGGTAEAVLRTLESRINSLEMWQSRNS